MNSNWDPSLLRHQQANVRGSISNPRSIRDEVSHQTGWVSLLSLCLFHQADLFSSPFRLFRIFSLPFPFLTGNDHERGREKRNKPKWDSFLNSPHISIPAPLHLSSISFYNFFPFFTDNTTELSLPTLSLSWYNWNVFKNHQEASAHFLFLSMILLLSFNPPFYHPPSSNP